MVIGYAEQIAQADRQPAAPFGLTVVGSLAPAFLATASPGIAALTTSSPLFRRLAPESGKGESFSRPPHNTLRAGPHRAFH